MGCELFRRDGQASAQSVKSRRSRCQPSAQSSPPSRAARLIISQSFRTFSASVGGDESGGVPRRGASRSANGGAAATDGSGADTTGAFGAGEATAEAGAVRLDVPDVGLASAREDGAATGGGGTVRVGFSTRRDRAGRAALFAARLTAGFGAVTDPGFRCLGFPTDGVCGSASETSRAGRSLFAAPSFVVVERFSIAAIAAAAIARDSSSNSADSSRRSRA